MNQVWIVDVPSKEFFNEFKTNNPNSVPSLKPKSIKQVDGFVLGLQISPNGRYLACTLRKYLNPEEIKPIKPSDRRSFDHYQVEEPISIYLYDLTTCELITVLNGCTGKSSVEQIFLILPEFSPCSRFLCCGSEDGSIVVWNIDFNIEVARLVGHTDVVNFCVWHPTLPLLVSGSDDNTLRVWSVADETSPFYKSQDVFNK